MKTDIVSALWIGLVAMLFVWAWRTVGGIAASSDSTKVVGEAMLAISG